MSALNDKKLDSVNHNFVSSKQSTRYREVPDSELSEDDKAILNGASSMVLKHSGTFGNEPLLKDQELKLLQGSLPKAEDILKNETEEAYGMITEADFDSHASVAFSGSESSTISRKPKRKLSYKEMLEEAKAKKSKK